MTTELQLPTITSRLSLRRFRPEDASPFAQYRGLEEVYRYQSWPRPFTLAMAREMVVEMAMAKPLVPGRWFQVALAWRESGALVGDLGLCRSDQDRSRVELGFSLVPQAQGRGLMREALQHLFAALPPLGITRVDAVVDARNAPCLRLLERLGFTQGERHEATYFGERCVDVDHRLELSPAPTPPS